MGWLIGLLALIPLAGAEVARGIREGQTPVLGTASKAGGQPALLTPAAGKSVPLVEFDRIELPVASAPPPDSPTVRLAWGAGEELLAAPPTIDAKNIRVVASIGTFAFPRRSLRQLSAPRSGITRLEESFRTLTADWTSAGEPKLDSRRFRSAPSSLLLEVSGQSVERAITPRLVAGEFLFWIDDESPRDSAGWTASFAFGDPKPAILKIGRSGDRGALTAACIGSPKISFREAPSRTGWRRVRLTFSPTSIALTVDDAAVAWSFDQGMGGPLTKIRFERLQAPAAQQSSSAVRFDDLTLIESYSRKGSGLADPSQAQLTDQEGDRWFGELKSSDANGMVFRLATGATLRTPWDRFRSLEFASSPASPRLEWTGEIGRLSAPGVGEWVASLIAADEKEWTLEHPLLGRFKIPTERISSWTPRVWGRRTELFAGPFHLGDKLASEFDRPMPDGTKLRTEFTLAAVPVKSRLCLWVQGMEGTGLLAPFASRLRAGSLRSEVWINGKNIDYLNRHIASRSAEPTPLQLDVPVDALRVGDNTLEIRQTPDAKTGAFDEAEVSQLTLELTLPRETSK
jgi:hypothetical protein